MRNLFCHLTGSGCGFMPQEIALDVDLTVRETLAYFARLHNLSERLINERTEWLLSLLDLSVKFGKGKDCMVKNLSGGQKRRVSLAAALIHKPRLVILDEPTVGVDPVLRERVKSQVFASAFSPRECADAKMLHVLMANVSFSNCPSDFFFPTFLADLEVASGPNEA